MEEVLAYNCDDVVKIREHFQMDENKIKESVEILKSWIAQQIHLPNDQDDVFLERCLLRNKFRIEQTKNKIEAYYTLRGIYREFFIEKTNGIVPSREMTMYLPFPRVTPNQERITVSLVRNKNPDLYEFLRISQIFMLSLEICLRNDYAVGEKIILDLEGFSLSHIKKISVAEFYKCYTLYSKTYSGRFLGIYLINSPPYVNAILTLFKIVFPEKLYSRVSIHNKGDDLTKVLPKECLPSDYGGDLPSIDELTKKWDKTFEANYEMFNKNYHNVSNESLRVGDLPENHYFGTDGTFKKLNLD